MKKLLLASSLALLLGLSSVGGMTIAGPPDGWGIVKPSGDSTDSQPVATTTSSGSDTITIMGPPDGWG